MKQQNRKSMPVNLVVPIIDADEGPGEKIKNGWMSEESKTSTKDDPNNPW